jgi:hypothetical protein
LAHGPDWDDEGHHLLSQANSNAPSSPSQKVNAPKREETRPGA